MISQIDTFCLDNEVIAYHFTRAIPEDILKHGLLARSGVRIRREFLHEHRDLFNKKELAQIQEAWKRSFNDHDEQFRDYHIFFNFTLNALKNGGAESLLGNYGGEQIYVPLRNIPGVREKIANIGVPLIVKCTLDPNRLNTFIEHPWGMIVTSAYHRTQNPDAHVTDQDGYQTTSVPAGKIEVIRFEELDA